MLFILSDELIENDSPTVKRAVRNLAQVTFESHHILYGSIKCLKYFESVFSGDDDIRAVFHYIISNYTTCSIDAISRRVIVVNHVSVPYVEENGYHWYQVAIDDLQESEKCRPINLIGENIEDCRFYEHVLQWFLKTRRLSIHWSVNRISGGGATLAQILQEESRNKHIWCAFVDTDWHYPDAPYGRTHEDCKKYLRRTKWNRQLNELHVQEIENLVPFNIVLPKIDLMYRQNQIQKEWFEKIYNNNPSLLAYFDIKKGIKVCQIANANDRELEYIKACCVCNSDIDDIDAYIISKQEEQEKRDADAKPLYIYPPLGRILSLFLEDAEKNGNIYDELELIDFQKDEWNGIGEILLNFSCARNKEALNG